MLISKQILFLTLYVIFLLSIFYFSYYICKSQHIYNENNITKLKKIILLYIFPILSIFIIICFFTYFLFINIWVALALIIIEIFYFFGLILILKFENIIVGTILITLTFLITFGLFNINVDSLKTLENEQITVINLNDYSKENSSKEDIFINLSSKYIINTQTDIVYKNNNDIFIYAFMQYDKTDKYNLPFLLQNIEYEIIDDENNRIEIVTKTIKKHCILSYFDFIEPKIEYKDTYKLFLNKNCINFS